MIYPKDIGDPLTYLLNYSSGNMTFTFKVSNEIY